LEGLFNVGPGFQVARLNADGGIASAWLVVAVFQYFEEVTIVFEGDTFAEIVYINHCLTFLVLNRFKIVAVEPLDYSVSGIKV
jgi:hypothetical protein